MVTTKRQINKERDRFGGYEEETRTDDVTAAERYSVVTPADISSVRTVGKNNVVVSDTIPGLEELPPITAGAAYAHADTTEKPLYTTRETIAAVPPRPNTQRKPLEHEDIMPSIKTRQTLEHMPAEREKKESASVAAEHRRAHTNLNPRTKVLLLVYLAVAFVLAVAVIATGISISRASAQSDELAEQIAAKQAAIVEQEAILESLTNEATIRDEAIANGMVTAGDPSYTAPRVEKVEYPEATPHTNGFDKFCDWFANIIM